MSEENVEIVRRYSENRLPRNPSLDEVMEWVAGFWESNGDYYPVRKFPEARPCHGREEIARFFTEYLAPWEYDFVVKEVKAVGEDRVLANGRILAKGTASGVTLEGEIYQCFWLRHRRFIRCEDHLTAKGALHALGLSGDTLRSAGLSE